MSQAVLRVSGTQDNFSVSRTKFFIQQGTGAIKIDRRSPIVLDTSTSVRLYNEVDVALQTIHETRRALLRISIFYSLTVTVLIILQILVYTGTLGWFLTVGCYSDYRYFFCWIEKTTLWYVPIFPIIGLVLVILCCLIMINQFKQGVKSLRKSMIDICARYSNTLSTFKFSFCDNYNDQALEREVWFKFLPVDAYINQCSLLIERSDVLNTMEVAEPSTQQTPAERLAELDKLKELITDEEYSEKRKEILGQL